MSDFISLSEASRLLTKSGITGVTYWQLWRRATEGKIPAERVAGRLLVKRDDLPKVADTFAPVEQ